MGTHKLENTDREISKEMERVQASEEDAPTGESVWRDKSEDGRNAS
jgi:hypothetical protein